MFEFVENIFPKKYLKELRKIATQNNCVLIFDEITQDGELIYETQGQILICFMANPESQWLHNRGKKK